MAAKRNLAMAAALFAGGMSATDGVRAQNDPLATGFRDPPKAARPQVWWHWMNGNISEEGARLDLEWLRRIGVGGVQLFEAGLGTPTIVPHRLVYMSPDWKAALRGSVASAARLGLDFTIAASPGWSATGGPWVRPADAMKKLVWSETKVTGGHLGFVKLPAPPAVSGPFQDVALSAVEAGASDAPPTYADARVIAFPSTDTPAAPVRITASTGRIDPTLLGDGAWGPALFLPYTSSDPTAWLLYDFGQQRTFRSIALGLPGLRGFGAPKPPLAIVEASDDGLTFRRIASLSPSFAPMRSASFPAVTARWFRVRLAPDLTPSFVDMLRPAPGAVPPQFGPPPPLRYAVSEVRFGEETRVAAAAEKAGFATLLDYYAASTPAAVGVDPRRVIDLSRKMRADGTLDWTPPPGRWTVLRMGWSLTGHRNGPAPDEATGLEVDKLDGERVSAYIDGYLEMYRGALGQPLNGAGLTGLLSDSIEAGPQNWTENLPVEFRKRHGYDPTPWLPALTGVVIQDSAATDRFLWDWRKTLADLYVDAHYAVLQAAAVRDKLSYYAEALEDHRPQLGDDLAMRAAADVPMAAMWVLPPDGEPNPTYVADIKGAVSVADLYGKPLVAAESFTAFGQPWAFAPADLKPTADLEMALGVSRIVIHESAHQPLQNAAPGLALAPFLGQYFSRNETWAPMADGWISYLARSSFLLQQGRHVADIAYFFGEEAPLTALYGDAPPGDIPAGHDFDFVNADALTSRLRVVDGGLVTPGGLRYPLLQLGGSSRYMTLATLRRVRDLLWEGAVVVGKRPLGSPSLADDPRQVGDLIRELWGSGLRPRAIGRGRLFPDGDATAALAALALPRDWQWTGAAQAKLAVLHRRLDDGDLYFVVNRRARAETGDLTLRVAGRVPELWHADTGRAEAVSYRIVAGVTHVALGLGANEAVFVILRRPATAAAVTITTNPPRELARLASGWRLRFEPGRGAPSDDRPAELGSWTQSNVPGIRYFSGIGTYSHTITVDRTALRTARRVMLDLGDVRDVAEVQINGVRAGVAWKAPYRVDVTGLLRTGRNDVKVRVANLWVNRLIGDAQPGTRPVAFTTGPTYAATAPLRRSGMLGPVRLVALD